MSDELVRRDDSPRARGAWGDSEVKVSPSLEPGRVRLSVRIGGRGLVLTPSADMARWIAQCLVRMAEKAEAGQRPKELSR